MGERKSSAGGGERGGRGEKGTVKERRGKRGAGNFPVSSVICNEKRIIHHSGF